MLPIFVSTRSRTLRVRFDRGVFPSMLSFRSLRDVGDGLACKCLDSEETIYSFMRLMRNPYMDMIILVYTSIFL